MELYISILLGVIFGANCSYIATRRGRNPRKWFIIGLLFGLIALIIVLILPSIKSSSAANSKRDRPYYRFAQSSDQELDKLDAISSMEDSYKMGFWFYLDKNHAQIGPIDYNKLMQAWDAKEIHSNTYVWTEGMTEWQKILQLKPDLFPS